jgi:hypothetical protein
MTELYWETIESYGMSTCRAKVPGGWLVAILNGSGSGITFYPDPNHKWDVKSYPPR